MKKVIVAACGRFHIVNVAEQLAKRGMLAHFITTEKIKKTDKIPRNLVTRMWPMNLLVLAEKACAILGFSKLRKTIYAYKNTLFDWCVSRKLDKLNGDVFYFLTNQSPLSAIKAKAKGMETIVECGGAYPGFYENIKVEEAKRFGQDYVPVNRDNLEFDIADKILVPSSFAVKTFPEHLRNKLKVLYMGVDTTMFYSGAVDCEHCSAKPFEGMLYDDCLSCVQLDGKFRVLYCGSIEVAKGVPYLLEAWKKAKFKDAELWLVGVVHSDMKKMLDSYADPSIIVKGHVTKNKLKYIYAKSTVLVFPSVCDGFGLVLLEALECGIPIIASENSGGPDIVREGDNGWVVPIRDSKEILSKLKILYKDKAKRSEMHFNTFRDRGKYSWGAYGDKWEQEVLK